MTCQHTVTQGREGSRNSWCVACGALTLIVHSETCAGCRHYEPESTPFGPHPRVGMCRHKDVGPMRITASMHVTYYAEPGPHRHGLCFEPVVPRS
jgi:hypothetical protein